METFERTLTPNPHGYKDLLAALTSDGGITAALTLPDGTRYTLPDDLADALYTIATALQSGAAVQIIPHHTTLTTSEAASMLGISRPTLIALLEAGKIPHTTPNRHRRIRLTDVLDYRANLQAERDTELDELSALSQARRSRHR